jgi:hypothetical protein
VRLHYDAPPHAHAEVGATYALFVTRLLRWLARRPA